MLNLTQKRGGTDSLCDRLRQIGNVQVGRLVVSLSLETSVEALTCEADFIAKEVEGLDALLRVADILELGKAESVQISILPVRTTDRIENIPLAGTGGCVDDGLALLNLTEARSILQEEFIIGGGV